MKGLSSTLSAPGEVRRPAARAWRLAEVSVAAHGVIAEGRKVGVYVYGGGIEEPIEPVRVSVDGSVSTKIYPSSRIKGGSAVLEVLTQGKAVEWTHRIAGSGRLAGATRVHAQPRELMPASATKVLGGR